MKRKTYALAAGILPFIAVVPLPVSGKSASGAFNLDTEYVLSAKRSGAIAGFPSLSPTLLAAKTAKTVKTVKCPPSPSKPTKKCKP